MSYPQLLTTDEKAAAAKYALELPPIVVICGSTRFMADMVEADLELTASGYIVVKPGCDMKGEHPLWADPADAERIKTALDKLHRAKIRLADDVLVVGDYIGDSTRGEIAYAREHIGRLKAALATRTPVRDDDGHPICTCTWGTVCPACEPYDTKEGHAA